MAERGPQRQIHLLYSFDRLAERKISQAYRLLVPEKTWLTSRRHPNLTKMGDIEYEDSGNLRESIIREAKRRTDHR